MLNEAIKAKPMTEGAIYSLLTPTMRACELPEIKSLPIRDLFPELPEGIYIHGGDVSIIRRRAEKALAGVDMSMIKPHHTVNVLCSEHGFNVLGGLAYAEMIKTIKDVVQERTGCTRIRVRFTSGLVKTEGKGIFKEYGLTEHYEGRVDGVCPLEEGMPVETEIGTMYVLKKAFDGDWFIHTHYDCPREIYFNRLITRIFKPFAMSYARIETRSLYHLNFGPRSGNIVPRVIFESLKHKHAFSIELTISPNGLRDVTADNDIYRLDRKGSINTLKSFGKIFSLYRTIEDVIPVLDYPRPLWYGHCGGVIAGTIFKSHFDLFDLNVVPRVTETLDNPAVKAVVVNHSCAGYYGTLPLHYPIFLSDKRTAMTQTADILPYATIAESLPHAMELAYKAGKTDKVMVFDGNYGGFNVSASMAEFLIEKAPEARRIEEENFSKWLIQRGIDPEEVNN